jgi:hypothetical protein
VVVHWPSCSCDFGEMEMPANRFNGFTDYGIGIGLRAPHYDHILTRKPVVDWFEIISENFMIDGGRPLQILDSIFEQYKVVQHGVSMYFGSAEKPNREHLRRLKELVKRTKTPWVSDHLCWGSVDGRYTHDLLPMPYTFEAAKITAQKVREVRDFLEVPVAVENVSSYAEFHVSEMTEWEFLNEVVERADCGILLDVNNIYVSSQNHNFRSHDLCEQRSRRTRRADSHRGPFEIPQVHSGYARPSGDRSGLETVRARHPARRPHGYLAGVGRQHSLVQGSSR